MYKDMEKPLQKIEEIFEPTLVREMMMQDLEDIDDEMDELEEEPKFNPYQLGKLFKELEKSVQRWIADFFEDKEFHCGGSIPRSLILSEEAVEMVIGTDFLEGTDVVLEVLRRVPMPFGFNEQLIDWDVHNYLRINKMVRQKGVPKPFQAGIMLLYLKVCEGRSLPMEKINALTHVAA